MTEREWIVTFGYDHIDPVTLDSLDGRFVRVQAETEWRARERVHESYGVRWAFIYSNERRAGVERYDLKESPFRTPEQVEEAQLLRLIGGFVNELSRPLWIYRAANGMCPPHYLADPASPRSRSAFTRRRNAARELRELIKTYAKKIEGETA